MRVRLDIAYDGRHFHGWAKQTGVRTVQGEIEAALAQILRRPVDLTVAGRTDAGVHALGQVAHADLAEREVGDPNRLANRVNSVLAMQAGPVTGDARGHCDVVVNRVRVVADDFDARFSALARHYQYRMATGGKNPLERHHTWWLHPQTQLNIPAMQDFADRLLGEHDFLSFCKPRPGATMIRELQRLQVEAGEGGLVTVDVQADAFCHSMVRSLIGALELVGSGKKGADWADQLVGEPSRSHSVPIAPAHGLTLVKVDYPPPAEWGRRAQATRHRRDQCC